MYICLNSATIGVKADLRRSIDLASRHNFPGVDVSIVEIADLVDEMGKDSTQSLFDDAGVRPGAWGFPVNFRLDEGTWEEGMAALPRLAQAAQSLKLNRCYTYIIPGHDELTFEENFDLHANRLQPAAQILADHGIRFGLEWVGTKEFRERYKYQFIHTIDGMSELNSAIGTPNMGYLVDIFHVENSYATADDVRKLSKEQVVYVHVNDGEAGVAVDERKDNIRDLPGYTKELDLTGFLHALRDIGYDGPVVAEPFNQRLRDLPDEEAVAEISTAMHKMWEAAAL
ncbi:MAG: TIM barrel protein [Chloroflexota bacterium]